MVLPFRLLTSPRIILRRLALPRFHPTTITTTLRSSPHCRHLHVSLRVGAPRTFKLADIGEGITECEILKWHVQPSQQILQFDPLCEVQSDKASVEITSPWEGRVVELCVEEGGVVKVGQGLCVVDVVGDEAEAEGAGGTKPEVKVSSPELPSPAAAVPPAPTPMPSSAPQASTPPPAQTQASTRRPHPLDPRYPQPPLSSPSSPPPHHRTHGQTATPFPSQLQSQRNPNPLALPSVRHYAKEQGIDDISVVGLGSGKGGRIEKVDVDRYLALVRSGTSSTAASGMAGQAMPGGSVGSARGGEMGKVEEGRDEVVELGRTRWAMFRAMTASLQIPHFGYSAQLDLTALSHLLPSLNAHIPPIYSPRPAPSSPPPVSPESIYRSSGSTPPASLSSAEEGDPLERYDKIGFLPLVVKGLAGAMMEWPLFRSTLSCPPNTSPGASDSTSPRPSLTVRPHADISLALSTPTGLYTPTLFSVDQLSPYSIAGKIARLSRLGRQTPSALTPAEFGRGGTVAVSNIGAIGSGSVAHPLLAPGIGVAIVVLGRAKWVDEVDQQAGEKGEVRRRLKMDVSWAGDHRVVEGAEVAAFVEAWRGWVENPGRMIGAGR